MNTFLRNLSPSHQVGLLFVLVFGILTLISVAAFVMSLKDTHEDDLHTQKLKEFNGLLRTVEAGRGLFVPPGIWILAVLALLVAGLLRYTVFGRHLFAIGSNERTARLCGVRVERVKVAVYTLSAALAGVAGVMQFAKLSAV